MKNIQLGNNFAYIYLCFGSACSHRRFFPHPSPHLLCRGSQQRRLRWHKQGIKALGRRRAAAGGKRRASKRRLGADSSLGVGEGGGGTREDEAAEVPRAACSSCLSWRHPWVPSLPERLCRVLLPHPWDSVTMSTRREDRESKQKKKKKASKGKLSLQPATAWIMQSTRVPDPAS